MKVIELFAGIGACSTALKRLGLDIEIVDAVEIDKYAIASFNAIHGTNFEVQDIKEWNKNIKDIDIITHGSPCQDFSVAGKQAGGDIGSGTRSSLMYETIRIVGQVRSKYVLWENVKNLLSKKHKHNFDAYIETMNILGYNSYYQVLNAKDYGIPQNRERVYTISIRKDIDKSYVFPTKEGLKLRLKDMLEDEVDEKYYLDDAKIDKIVNSNFMQEKKRIQEKEYVDTILARDWKDPKCVRIGGIFDTEKSTHQAGSIYDKEGLSPTLSVMQGGWRQPSIMIKNATQKGYDEAIDGDSVNLQYPESKTRRGGVGHQVSQTLMANDNMGVVEPFIVASRGRNPENPSSRATGEHTEQRLEPNMKGTTNCITSVQKDNWLVENTLRIRKLTPKECWRLMGFSDEEFEKAQNVPMSNTQLYKQAGNSIVVNVLEKIFKNLF